MLSCRYAQEQDSVHYNCLYCAREMLWLVVIPLMNLRLNVRIVIIASRLLINYHMDVILQRHTETRKSTLSLPVQETVQQKFCGIEESQLL